MSTVVSYFFTKQAAADANCYFMFCFHTQFPELITCHNSFDTSLWRKILVTGEPLPMKRESSIIVWFRTDLRLHDNPALAAAVRQSKRIIPLYIYAPEEEGHWQPGAASRWWLHHSLSSLGRDLKQLGSRLVLRAGNSFEQLHQLIEETGASSVYTTRCYTPAGIKRDKNLQRSLQDTNIVFKLYNGNLLLEPDSIHNKF